MLAKRAHEPLETITAVLLPLIYTCAAVLASMVTTNVPSLATSGDSVRLRQDILQTRFHMIKQKVLEKKSKNRLSCAKQSKEEDYGSVVHKHIQNHNVSVFSRYATAVSSRFTCPSTLRKSFCFNHSLLPLSMSLYSTEVENVHPFSGLARQVISPHHYTYDYKYLDASHK